MWLVQKTQEFAGNRRQGTEAALMILMLSGRVVFHMSYIRTLSTNAGIVHLVGIRPCMTMAPKIHGYLYIVGFVMDA